MTEQGVTFKSIWITIIVGLVVFIACFLFFGYGVKKNLREISPRCAARPPESVYNPDPKDPSQERGNPYFGWMKWVMSLSYETMLRGVPGTGTRGNGLEGQMLNVNLDQIVMLRFHALCLKVAFLVTVLCMFVILPLYSTTSCPDSLDGDEKEKCWRETYANITDYEGTTLANVPQLSYCSSSMFVGGDCMAIRWRLIAVVLCTWIIWYRCCDLLKKEWEYLLPIRRKYYLEEDFWKNRREQLKDTMLATNSIDEKEYRDPWIPHPETRDTAENIELYSVLVGHLPTPPVDLENGRPPTEAEIMEWQLKAATSFFDYCVPNQPGFSSSIAAITMLPSSKELAVTWKRWRAAAYATRRLRFIRRLIADRMGVEADTAPASTRSSFRFSFSSRGIYKNSSRHEQYYRDVMDMHEDHVKESVLSECIENFGPEQTSTYSLQLARSASGCCPNGSERGLRKASLEELRILEEEALDEVLEANKHLKTAQQITGIESGSGRLLRTRIEEGDDAEESVSSGRKFNSVFDDDSGTSKKDPFSGAWNLPELEIKPDLKKVAKKFGVWQRPQLHHIEQIVERVFGVGRGAAVKTKDVAGEALKDLIAESTYAVATFTSRQAAIAARQCLLDGRGKDQWIPVQNLPIPPLADGPTMSCCNLVSLTIPAQQKRYRKLIVYLFLAGFYPFYSIPLTLALNSLTTHNAFVDPFSTESNPLIDLLVKGLIPAVVMTTFFAVLPQIFKLLANFGSNAPSKVEAEYSALRYYWFFMNIFAFWGTTVGTTLHNAFVEYKGGNEYSSFNIEKTVGDIIKNVGLTLPTVVSSTWLNWMIIRTTCTLPLNYMIFVNSFLFKWIGIPCLSRATYGGGAGGPIPYRIYVDSGITFLTLVAVAPVAPLLAPFALVSFLYMQPLLRRNALYAYRPQFDAGGFRWIFLSDIIITCLLTGQLVLAIMMGLKIAIGPAVMAALPLIPTIMFKQDLHHQYKRAYEDAALLQTSQLDGWDSQDNIMSFSQREEFRRFLVDCHKAAYIPACLVCTELKEMSFEPAEVVRLESDPVERGMLRRTKARKGGLNRRTSKNVSTTNLQPLIFDGLGSITPPDSPQYAHGKKTPAEEDTKGE